MSLRPGSRRKGKNMPEGNGISGKALAQLFRDARTHNAWTATPVADETLQALYELMKWGPTSANCSPLRILFLKSEEQKRRLEPMLSEGNRAKSMAAPVVAILAYERKFYDRLGELFPHAPAMRDLFAGEKNRSKAETAALRNSSLQGGYFILAARALGLDCGPMSGFNAKAVDNCWFPENDCHVNFICNLGYGNPDGLRPRSPRLRFDDACKIL